MKRIGVLTSGGDSPGMNQFTFHDYDVILQNRCAAPFVYIRKYYDLYFAEKILQIDKCHRFRRRQMSRKSLGDCRRFLRNILETRRC